MINIYQYLYFSWYTLTIISKHLCHFAVYVSFVEKMHLEFVFESSLGVFSIVLVQFTFMVYLLYLILINFLQVLVYFYALSLLFLTPWAVFSFIKKKLKAI